MSNFKERNRPILIIASDADDRGRLRDILSHYPEEFPEVVEVDSVAGALAAIRDHMPLCCLLDYKVTDNEGKSALAQLRRHLPAETLPVIIAADVLSDADAAHLLHTGAQDYLIKSDLTALRLYGAVCNAVKATELQHQLQHLAHYDALTGLLNRNLLMNRLDLALKRCDRYKQRCVLLSLDLDQFKPVNETYGHAAGDCLLQAVAERIRSHCRSTDSPARLGGDEFVVLLEQVDKSTGAKVANKILQALSEPFDIFGQTVSIKASVGLATYPDTSHSAEELLKQADQALEYAKSDPLVPLVHFSAKYKRQWQRQHVLERELPKAITEGELSLVYQPIVDSQSYELKRLEVLSRWPREDYAVNALELMEMIDRLNLIEPFHEWLFNTAFGQLSRWRTEAIYPDLCLNIPANYCYSTVIAKSINASIDRHSVAPNKIELEITESTLMRHPERSIKVLQALHNKGMRIAIDDFGTGYSSMAYLTRLPLDTLKVDRNFFLVDPGQERNRKVIEAIAALGHSLGLEIIAEGVETDVQLALAKAVGCDLLQGFYFGRPAFPGVNWNDYLSHFEHVRVSGFR